MHAAETIRTVEERLANPTTLVSVVLRYSRRGGLHVVTFDGGEHASGVEVCRDDETGEARVVGLHGSAWGDDSAPERFDFRSVEQARRFWAGLRAACAACGFTRLVK